MLHIVNKSPYERNALESCLRLSEAGSDILLIEDGVYAAIAGTAGADKISGKTDGYSFYVLGPDLQARGMAAKEIVDGVEVIDYAGFVNLVEKNDSSTSWL
ncbi:MAG: sulfurtransferase complex subunit TusB [Magnetospiraceae bacterium]